MSKPTVEQLEKALADAIKVYDGADDREPLGVIQRLRADVTRARLALEYFRKFSVVA